MRRIWNKICPICGAEFETTFKGTKYCLEHRGLHKTQRDRILRGPLHCTHCGKTFEGHGNALFCSEACKKAHLSSSHREVATKEPTHGLLRKCHDCGRATTDYRCPVCQKKFRQRHNVSPEASCPEAWLYA